MDTMQVAGGDGGLVWLALLALLILAPGLARFARRDPLEGGLDRSSYRYRQGR